MPKSKNFSLKHTSRIRPGTSVPSALNLRVLAGVALLVLAAFLAYFPALSGGFVMDDNLLLTENSLIKAADGLWRFWCTTEATDYWPVSNTTLWIEWRLWKMNPVGYHVTNLILHIVEVLLLWAILRKLSIPGAYFASLIFAVHPVNVESVAWISSRKNLMAMLFLLLSILWYLSQFSSSSSDNAQRSRHTPCADPAHGVCGPHIDRWYWLSLLAFVLAMFSKGSVAVLPVLLLGIIWWLRPLTKWDLARTAPFFAIAAALVYENVWFQTHGKDMVTRDMGYAERLLGAGGVVWFYLYKAILPVDLAFVYPQWEIQVGNQLWWLPLLAVAGVTVFLWLYRERWSRAVFFAWGYFCVSLVPVLGFTDVGYMKFSPVADRYQHIAIIGVIALATAGWSVWHQRMRGAARWRAIVVAVLAAGAFGFLAYRQSGLYRNVMTLYQATLKKNPDCWFAHNNLGSALVLTGRTQEAIEHFQEALRLNPNYPDAHNNLGTVLGDAGQVQEAIAHYQQALRLKPDYVIAHNNLANALLQTGRPQEAIKHFQEALKLKPDFITAHYNLGVALFRTGRMQEAIEHYQQALRLEPDYPEAHNNLGNALLQAGRPQEASEHIQQALRLQPDYVEALNNMGLILANAGRLPEAIEYYQRALSLKSDYTEALNNLGVALIQVKRPQEAIEQYQKVIQLKPDLAEAHYNLALAYAIMHQSSQAVAAAQKALDIARSKGQTAVVKHIEDWLNAYRDSLSK